MCLLIPFSVGSIKEKGEIKRNRWKEIEKKIEGKTCDIVHLVVEKKKTYRRKRIKKWKPTAREEKA